jgi:hypothetical protein
MSHSLTKYLVDASGLDTFVRAILPHLLHQQAFEAAIERTYGKPLDTLRAGWLQKLSTPSQRPAPLPY